MTALNNINLSLDIQQESKQQKNNAYRVFHFIYYSDKNNQTIEDVNKLLRAYLESL